MSFHAAAAAAAQPENVAAHLRMCHIEWSMNHHNLDRRVRCKDRAQIMHHVVQHRAVSRVRVRTAQLSIESGGPR